VRCCFIADRTWRFDNLVPKTPRPTATNGYKGSTVKRKADFDTPATSKASKAASDTSPDGSKIAKVGATEVSNGLQLVLAFSSWVAYG